MDNRRDITVIVTRDVTVGRMNEERVMVLRDIPVHRDPRPWAGEFVRLPGVATCDGYRTVTDDAVRVNAREAASMFRKHCKHPAVYGIEMLSR